MKNNIAIAALAAALLLTGCSNGNSSASEQSSSSVSESASTAEAELKTAAEKADAVLANITFSGEMVAVDTDTIDVRFGFSADGISDYAAYICGSGAYPDEFGVFTADYTPDEMYKFDDCFVKQDGNTVYYAVTADNTKAADILG